MTNVRFLNVLNKNWEKFSCISCDHDDGKVMLEVEIDGINYTLKADDMDFVDFLIAIDAIEFWEDHKVTFEVSKGLDDTELASLPLDEFLEDFPAEEDITRALDGTMFLAHKYREEFTKMLMKTPVYETV